jgi:hypothetical protein
MSNYEGDYNHTVLLVMQTLKMNTSYATFDILKLTAPDSE